MHFELVDRVLEQSADRIVTIKHVSAAEEYLQDHFPTFPVLPGVMMLEAMVQAGRTLANRDRTESTPLVLSRVRALKYGKFVKPGATLQIRVERAKPAANDEHDLKGEVLLIEPGAATPEVACSGRITLRPANIARA